MGFAFIGSAQKTAIKTIQKTEQVVTKDSKGNTDKKKVEQKVVLKKDGTSHKRYNATKTKVKKDGAPDRRNKENK